MAMTLASLTIGAGGLMSFALAQTRKNEPNHAGDGRRPTGDDVQRYCANIVATSAAAALTARERQLRELEQEIKQRLGELEAKRVEIQQAMDRYESVIRKAGDALVNVYSLMKPDAAAAQIASLDDDAGAGLLLRLKPKSSSAILSEMETSRAAALTKRLAELSAARSAGAPR